MSSIAPNFSIPNRVVFAGASEGEAPLPTAGQITSTVNACASDPTWREDQDSSFAEHPARKYARLSASPELTVFY